MWKTSPVRSVCCRAGARLDLWTGGSARPPDTCGRGSMPADEAGAGPPSGNRPAGGMRPGVTLLKVKPTGRYLNGKSKPSYLGGAVACNSTRTPEDTMPEPAPSGAILASHSVNRPGEVDRLNAILESARLG